MTYWLSSVTRLWLGALLALLAALAAYRLKLLTRAGAIAAFVLGWVVFGLGGLEWALVMIAFFTTSSGWSKVFKKRKSGSEKMYAKGGTRDASQVLANGGVAGVFVLLHLLFPESVLPWAGFCAALAAANADTWATELGILNRGKPVKINSGERVEPGTSGAVSLAGTLAAAAGAGLIGVLALIWMPGGNLHDGRIFSIILFSGLIGSLVDSLLGATLQAIYYCPACQKETEKHPLHGCGNETRLIRGLTWLNNEWVNIGCTLSAALLAILLVQLFIPWANPYTGL